LIFKEKAKFKETGLREKGLAQPHYSTQHIEGYDLLCYKEKIYIPHSLRQNAKIETKTNEYCPDTNSIYFIKDSLKQKRTLRVMIFFSTKKRSTFLNHQYKDQRILSWYHEYLLHPGQTIRNTMT
jgi:hypothetical protein